MRRTMLLVLSFCIGVTLYTVCLRYMSTARAEWNLQLSGIPRHILVDDFENGFKEPNKLGGPTSCWAEGGGTITCTSDFEGSQGRLKMHYDVSASTDAYALYTAGLRGLNAVDIDTVWVSFLGAAGGEKLYVELSDCGLHGEPQFPKVTVDDYLPQGIITSSWSAAAIPITAFEAITDPTCISLVNVLAHHKIKSDKGSVLIDNVQFLPDNVLIDDFGNQDEFNHLGGITGFWNNPENQNHLAFSYPNGELKLDYDVRTTRGISEAIYWSNLQNSKLVVDKDILTFDIRGEKGGEQVAIEFRDCGLTGERQIPKVKVGDYLPSGITTTRQNVSIPLWAFGPEIDWNCIENLNVLVSSHPWFNSRQGTVYIDNITVSPTADLPPLMIDNFNDCNIWNARLKEWHSDRNLPATISARIAGENVSNRHGCNYQIDYKVDGDSSAWLIADLDSLDVSKYNYLSFFISGTVGNEEPHIYLRDNQGRERLYDNIEPTKEGRKISIPLEYFDVAIDLTKLAEIRIAFEWKSMSGTVSIDDIGFVGKQKTYLPLLIHDPVPTPTPSVTLTPTPIPCTDSLPMCAEPGPYEPNNLRCSATPITLGSTISSDICDLTDTSDYYSVIIAEKREIRVKLSNIPREADYDVYLYDSLNEQIVAGSRRANVKEETFSYIPERIGKYYVRVYRVNGASKEPYTLKVFYE